MIDGLAAELGVSALPVREAIRRLEAEGLVVYRPNVGAQVAPADPGVFEHELTVLAVLEGYATALAAPRLEKGDLTRLRRATDEMATAMGRMDPLAFGRHNREFHEVFYERCPNPALVEMLREVERRLDAIRRTVFTHIPYRGAESIAEHRELIELVAGGTSTDRIETKARGTQAEDGRELPRVAGGARRRRRRYELTAVGSSTCELAARKARTRSCEAAPSGASGSRARPQASRPSCSMTHFAGTGLVSANAASTSGCRS